MQMTHPYTLLLFAAFYCSMVHKHPNIHYSIYTSIKRMHPLYVYAAVVFIRIRFTRAHYQKRKYLVNVATILLLYVTPRFMIYQEKLFVTTEDNLQLQMYELNGEKTEGYDLDAQINYISVAAAARTTPPHGK